MDSGRPVAVTSAVERVARVLAAWPLSLNADGEDSSAGADVNQDWPDRVEVAVAVLKALREPDAAMAGAGDTAVWGRMVDAAIAGQAGLDLPGSAPMPHVREAGYAAQSSEGPWTRGDERLDESFPASDPSPAQPGVD
jgi:hypothetical protein